MNNSISLLLFCHSETSVAVSALSKVWYHPISLSRAPSRYFKDEFLIFLLLAEINVKWQTQKSVNLANYLFLVGHSPHQSTNPQIHKSTNPHKSIVNCVLATPLFYDPTLNLRSKTTNTFVQKRKIQVWRVVQDGELYLQKMPAYQAWWANKLSNKLQLHPRDGFLDLQLRLTMIST